MRWPGIVVVAVTFAILCGCATRPPCGERTFAFGRDTMAFDNELLWDYCVDEQGKRTTRPRKPRPAYSLHCFPVARAAKAFFLNARFDASQPMCANRDYRRLVKKVMNAGPRRALPAERRIMIPGYPDLNAFSRDHELLLKQECGTAVSSYFQRGHWRMILPFSAGRRQKAAEQFCQYISNNCPVVVHICTFPSLTINHAIVIFDAVQADGKIAFRYYDPNFADASGDLIYDKSKRTFQMGPNGYFRGGAVQAYQVYHKWNY